ncbi:hypothetical protein SARC_11594 [Sphaeroforma arctica JP610]|uniref:Uncharacterized protein n=1 Tax=Sphaeroforma arctica JP610 TaxID=667725 RepID=A0A0L0FGJ2_9EUKA|nr:hypothetical protein SARC_11594 [Sphaeroforma arctica JP610]KNC75890.1 hypothetical protein SARC_11594 [Sphaeroforma arctica JP610]|eukprot:XP_014149792.1 hypothetical protein SARC_11594 [Sphaeroforma arctica JP610]
MRSKRGDWRDRSARGGHSSALDCRRIGAESGEIDKSGILTTPSTSDGRALKSKPILLQIGLSNDGVREPGTDVAEAKVRKDTTLKKNNLSIIREVQRKVQRKFTMFDFGKKRCESGIDKIDRGASIN